MNIPQLTQASFISPPSTSAELEKQTGRDLSLSRNHSLSDHSFLMEYNDEPFVNPFTSDFSGDIGGEELNSGSSDVSESLKQWTHTIGGRSGGSSSSNQNKIAITRRRSIK